MSDEEEEIVIDVVTIVHDGGLSKQHEFVDVNPGGKIALRRKMGASIQFWLSNGECTTSKLWSIASEDLLRIQELAHQRGVKFKPKKRFAFNEERTKSKKKEQKKTDPKQSALFPSWMLGDKE